MHQKPMHSLLETSEVKTPVHKEMVAIKTETKPVPKPAPQAKNLMATKITNADEFDKYSQNVDVPIDEIKAIT